MDLSRPALSHFIEKIPYPLVFVTVSGAHLYGFPSADSDYDLRGMHVLPAKEVVGLDAGPETLDFGSKLRSQSTRRNMVGEVGRLPQKPMRLAIT